MDVYGGLNPRTCGRFAFAICRPQASDGGTMAVDKTIVSGLWAAYVTF